ncbi:MAG: 50S ribosomal protein L7/L12 [Nitrospirae bacterium]|nr:MAG: 50S ribosomal protein L7/L12 [Nitrospirota bacterium]
MRKEAKTEAIAELHEKFSRARVAVLTECVGLEGQEVTELRRRLRGVKAELKVVKNTLAVLAAEGTPMSIAKEHFKGPLSLAIGYDDPALPAKILRDFIAQEKRDKKMRVTLGMVEGILFDAARMKAVADLPSRNVLLSLLLARMQSPIVGLVGTMNGILSNFVGVLMAIKDKPKEESMSGATAEKLSKEDFIKMIEGMTVLELDDYVKALQERFGVTAAAPVAAGGGGGAAAAAPAEEKTSFDVVLTNAGEKKIQVIKVVREVTNLGLKEAKDLVEGAPKPVKTSVTKEEADTIKKKLEEQGAKIDIK